MDYISSINTHNKKISSLIEKYIGENTWNKNRTQKKFLLSQIRWLSEQIGRVQLRKRRCKTDSNRFLEYENKENEYRLLVDEFSLYILM